MFKYKLNNGNPSWFFEFVNLFQPARPGDLLAIPESLVSPIKDDLSLELVLIVLNLLSVTMVYPWMTTMLSYPWNCPAGVSSTRSALLRLTCRDSVKLLVSPSRPLTITVSISITSFEMLKGITYRFITVYSWTRSAIKYFLKSCRCVLLL